jgi:hypothetical protein
MTFISQIAPYKVRVTCEGVALFNSRWPCSPLRSERAYWFEFDETGDLVDTDVHEHDDGSAAVAMAEDCKVWLFDRVLPEWIQEVDEP